MNIQNISVERNQLWKHKKGTIYKIFGVASSFTSQDTKFVLYYNCYENFNEEILFFPDRLIDVENLKEYQLVTTNVFNVIENLYINKHIQYKQYSKFEIEKLKNNKIQFLWARELNNFLEIHENGINRFELMEYKKTINFISIFENHPVTKHILDSWAKGESIEKCYETTDVNYDTKRCVIEYIYDLLNYQQDCDFNKMI